MAKTIAVIGAGGMGSGVARRLTDNGAHVVTLLEGRSDATLERAKSAGMIAADLDTVASAEIILSIVPPGEAVRVAEDLSRALSRSPNPAIFVDCNAVDVRTAEQIAAIIAKTPASVADGSIIGMPPQPNGKGPTLYFSGPEAGKLSGLADLGLRISILDAPIGAASALKMSYAGITKGLTAVAASMILAASRAGAAEALFKEMSYSQPELLSRFSTALPSMYSRAYRWVAEMQEIAAFAGEDPGARQIYEGAADLYERLAADHQGDNAEIGLLDAFFKHGKPAS
jgi:L-threonate 2-dehydrogenase